MKNYKKILILSILLLFSFSSVYGMALQPIPTNTQPKATGTSIESKEKVNKENLSEPQNNFQPATENQKTETQKTEYRAKSSIPGIPWIVFSLAVIFAAAFFLYLKNKNKIV